MSADATDKGFRLKGWHVLAMLLAFFGVIVTANTIFLTIAFRSFPGIVTDEPFEKGLAKEFNAQLEAMDEQRARGWRAGLESAIDATTGETLIRVFIVDGEGRPVDGLDVAGDLVRAGTTGDDRDLVFQPVGAGLYECSAGALSQGQWLIEIETAFPDGLPFKAEKRLWLS